MLRNRRRDLKHLETEYVPSYEHLPASVCVCCYRLPYVTYAYISTMHSETMLTLFVWMEMFSIRTEFPQLLPNRNNMYYLLHKSWPCDVRMGACVCKRVCIFRSTHPYLVKLNIENHSSMLAISAKHQTHQQQNKHICVLFCLQYFSQTDRVHTQSTHRYHDVRVYGKAAF